MPRRRRSSGEPVADAAVAASCAASQALRIGWARCMHDGAFRDWIAAAAEPVPAGRGFEDWSLMLYTSGTTGRPGVPRAASAPSASPRWRMWPKPLCDGRVHPGRDAAVPHDGRALAAVAGADRRAHRLPAALRRRSCAGGDPRRASDAPLSRAHALPRPADAPAFASTDTRSVRKLGFAGAPMHDALLQRLPGGLRAGAVRQPPRAPDHTFSINQRAVEKPGSAGVPASTRGCASSGSTSTMPACRADGRGPDHRRAAQRRGLEGYHKRPDADARSLHGGWYFTGDTGYVDHDGDLFVTGRVDDMIISGGENISPVDIESGPVAAPGCRRGGCCRPARRALGPEGRRLREDTPAGGPGTLTHCRDSDRQLQAPA